MQQRNTTVPGLAIMIASLTTAQTQAQEGLPQPTEEHNQLAKEVGVWDAETTMWYTPAAPPVTSKATETNKMLGKMWLVSEFKGDMGGMPFTGHGQFGYDPVSKKFVGTWIDSMSPYLSTMEGEMKDGKLVMMSKGRDFMTGKESLTKMVTTYKDDDHRTFEMHGQVPEKEGEWWKMMEVKYTRRK